MIVHRPPRKKSNSYDRIRYDIAQEFHHQPYSLCTKIQKQLVDKVLRERNGAARKFYHTNYINCSDIQKKYIKDHS